MGEEDDGDDGMTEEEEEELEEIAEEISATAREESEQESSESESQVDPGSVENPVMFLAMQRIGEITEMIKTWQEERREAQSRVFQHRETIVRWAAGTFVALIVISGSMTMVGALSADAFTFVLGTLFGSLVTFLQNTLRQQQGAE